MGKNSAPQAPDYSGITNALNSSSTTASNLQGQQYTWAQNQFGQNQGVSNQVTQADLGTQGQNQNFATSLQNQYQNTYQPLGDMFASQAANYASPERIQSEMGRAEATTAQQFDQARDSSIQQLESYGINPGSTRFAALDIGANTQKAAAVAGAGNQAYTNTVNTGLQLENQAITQGQVLPGQASLATNTALQAGSGAVNTGLATTASGANTMGTSAQYLGLGNNALATSGNVLNTSYQNQLSQTQLNNSLSSGWGSALGAAAGLGLGVASLGTGGGVSLGASLLGMGTNAAKSSNSSTVAGFAKGGTVPDPRDGSGSDDPQQQSYGKGKGGHRPFVDHHIYVLHALGPDGRTVLKPEEAISAFLKHGKHLGEFGSMDEAVQHFAGGGATMPQQGALPLDRTQGGGVPMGASPSGGAVVDDVNARLSPNEFVIPRDVAEWVGQANLQKMIQKARIEKQNAVAKPTVGSHRGPAVGGPQRPMQHTQARQAVPA